MNAAIAIIVTLAAGYGIALLWQALTKSVDRIKQPPPAADAPLREGESEELLRFEREQIPTLLHELDHLGFRRTFARCYQAFGNIIMAFTKETVVVRVIRDRGDVLIDIARVGTDPWYGDFQDLPLELKMVLHLQQPPNVEEIPALLATATPLLVERFRLAE